MVHDIIKDKLVIVCNGVKDFLSLQLEFSEYQTFEIQKIFRGWNQTYNKLGDKVSAERIEETCQRVFQSEHTRRCT